jgi:Tol biopolymer transport system component/tRNA A-37 threonylcarbamoyl transferase component Bud32
MTPERYQRVVELFQAATALNADARESFLVEACAGDEELQRDVKAMLVADARTGGFLQKPLDDVAADLLSDTTKTRLIPGSQLGPYRIEAPVGSGGMGQVYKARDTRLGRAVAIKSLSEQFSGQFEREAKAISTLNHPHICTLYDVGPNYLVMELLEGETLAARLKKCALPVDQVLEYGVQIADALAAAHEKGITHRDLKPSNIMLTRSGVKVLDFGLARMDGSPRDTLTASYVVMGTPAYMAPEQREGREADARSDIYSLGLVLYEMATGERAYEANKLQTLLPLELERVIKTCLAVEPDQRFQSALDVKRILGWAGDLSAAAGSDKLPAMRSPKHQSRFAWIAAAVLTVVAATFLYVFRASSLPPQPMHQQITFVGDAAYPAISPDGKFVVYVTRSQYQGRKLMLQDLKGGQAIELFKDASFFMSPPRWSPDGSEIAVPSSVSGNLILIPRLGGASRRIARGGFVSWSQDGRQLAVAFVDERGFRVIDKATGGVKPVPLTGFQWLYDLDWSPVSNLVAVLTQLDSGRFVIWTVRPDGSRQRKIVEEENRIASVRWSPVGDELYFLHGQAISKIPIDPKSGDTKGPPVALLTGLQPGQGFTLSEDGTRLAYIRTQAHSNLWMAEVGNPHGKEAPVQPLTSGTATFHSLSISPDGKWLAFIKGQFLFKMPMDGSAPTQLTFSDAFHSGTAWSPDGKRIAFGSAERGTNRVWIVDAEGGNPRQLVNTETSTGPDITWWPRREILYQKPENRNYGMLDPETGEEKPLVQDDSVGRMFPQSTHRMEKKSW